MNEPTTIASSPSPGGDFRLEGPLTVATAQAWRTRLLAEFARSPEVALDLAAVTEVDAFGLQLLWSARCTAAAAGKAFRLVGTTAAFSGACERAGFAVSFSPLNPRLP